MYKVCLTDQSSKRQRELEKGLLQLMQKQRYEDISVSDLCDYLQIPRKSFYRYFSCKDGALYALIDHTLADFFEMPVSAKKTRGTALGDLDLFFEYWYNNKSFLDALANSGLSGILADRANQFALREGHLPQRFKSVPTEIQGLAMAFSLYGLMSMTLHWHRRGFPVSAEEMTRLAIHMLTNPLLAP
ncbi:MAG: TetR/AcrR family transcriptional regulator [Ruminococcaceae bacterium]|nr:TetR/AcrR family transcriptional regulator [Oscillospiraceae bacterium]